MNCSAKRFRAGAERARDSGDEALSRSKISGSEKMVPPRLALGANRVARTLRSLAETVLARIPNELDNRKSPKRSECAQ
jgi:hypothetical protein